MNNLHAKEETQKEPWVRSLSQEVPWRSKMEIHSSIFAWEFHGQGNLVGYNLQGHKRARRDSVTEQVI